MNIRLLRRIIGFILTAVLLTGIILLSGATAAAQDRIQRPVEVVRPVPPFRRFGPFRPYGKFDRESLYSQYVFRNGEHAYKEGYKDGLKIGESDGRKDKSYDPERSHYFHDAGFGNFAEVYREGFSAGYRDGYEARGIG
jgi:hypothetical protein